MEEPPLRSELFSADQLERYGGTLAATHRLAHGAGRDRLLSRLAANEAVLIGVCKRLTGAVAANRRVSPAGEWLLDNFHLIEEQVGTAKVHLPAGYSRGLPRLATGVSAGLPRVYDIALEAISHGDGRIDADGLTRFIMAYQSVAILNLGELWAIPIMLRLALIENLRRVGVRIATAAARRDLANAWANRMIDTAERAPAGLILLVADMARSAPPMESAFVAELARRLQGQSAALALALTWMEQRLAESHLTIESLVRAENQQQAADQVSISNSIGSLRVLSAIDWRAFVETTSVVERTLRQDPPGIYRLMAFSTRDSYRHAAERIAKEGRSTEAEVAAKAVELAHAGAERHGADDRAAHVGFYLVDAGLAELERAAGAETARGTLRNLGRRFPLPLYLGAIGLIAGLATAAIAAHARAAELGSPMLTLAVVLLLIATSQSAVDAVNWLAALLVRPRALPRMDFSSGVPAGARTLVIVPTMLTSERNVEELVEALEVRFLANRDARVHFGLLTDLPDAPAQTLPIDATLLRLAETRIEELNRKYPLSAQPSPSSAERESDGVADDGMASVFYLFHRPRQWNADAGVWMGRERKRGKLGDLNALLRGGRRDRFSLIVGETAILSQVKYVVTLDTDTQLPRDAARLLIAAMAHPLNRARFDDGATSSGRNVVTSGHAILQPRVSVSLPGTNRSRYARLYGGDAGIDQYTRTVSDVYQDVFDEGSFIGKGIYDVDAFERALEERFPPNRILSHDLLEGCYVRAGLLSDAELYEAFPARYSADVARRRRWIRGDWQLAGWLRRWVARADGRRERNPLSLLSQWKLFDNLRRSVVSPTLTALLLLGWMVYGEPSFWTAVVLAVLLAPSLLATASDLAQRPAQVSLRQHLSQCERSALRRLLQALIALAFLPYEAYFCLDAIVRTLGRMLVTRRRLLEWNPSSDVDRALEHSGRTDLIASYRAMAVAPAIALATCIGLALLHPAALAVAGPILALWGAAPAIAWWVSRPLPRRRARLTLDQARFLRKLARKTWTYFETYVGAEDHWLPPDNVQEVPAATVAHRTSPTNMGLALLANLAAHDFAYVSTGRLLARTTDAIDSMASLERHRGHFYNWYDTRTLAPLVPLYVSTVDSGNLAGHLLTLRAGLAALCDAPILNRRWLDGASDTWSVLMEAIDGALPAPLAQFQRVLETVAAVEHDSLDSAWLAIERLAECAGDVAAHFGTAGDAADVSEASFWADALARQSADLRDDLLLLAPWLGASGTGGAARALPWGQRIPTLRELAALDPGAYAAKRIAAIEELCSRVTDLAPVDYTFLYDEVRRLLTIGYSVAQHRRDDSFYDLLASEARLGVFVAIAQGGVPQESWFALGRLLTTAGGEPVLLAWSGSMFEYLMPMLVMPSYENTLLDRTCIAAVERQIAYGRQRGVPWGVSESAYNQLDVNLNYQYRAFGVPGLGLKRGLGEDLVVAPYACALALMVAPEAACANLQRLTGEGVAGRLGMYEAIDYTPSRQRRGASSEVIRSYMAHHQGMSLLACAHVLLGRPMQRRFESDPLLQATLLLLQERVPRATRIHPIEHDLSQSRSGSGEAQSPIRLLNSAHTAVPEAQLLSNGRYHVMVTNAGGGSSRWRDLAVTRWREDATSDDWGSFCYVRDEATGKFWSTAYQPTLKEADEYEAIFSEGRAEFRREDFELGTHTEIVVSPEDDIELRRVHITNHSRHARTIDVTSYAEIVLAPAAADTLHPAFSNLFVQTEIVRAQGAILCSRRPRSREEPVPWMFHLSSVHGTDAPEISFETDRMRFIGRGGSVAAPAAMTQPGPLSNTAGSVLDPIVAIRHRLTIAAGATAVIDMVFGVSETRDAALYMVAKYEDRKLADRVFELAWTHSQVVLRQLNATDADAQLYGRLASSVIYANASLRAPANVLARSRGRQSALWGYAISGDLPIVLLQVTDARNIDLVRQLVQAHAYWRLKGLAVDLVIWNEDHDGYRQRLQEQILGLIAGGAEAHFVDRPGGIFVRHAEQISPEDRDLFQAVARAIITDRHGTLADHLDRRVSSELRIARLAPTRAPGREPAADSGAPPGLLQFNGIGGFAPDGREYVIAPGAGRTTPAPWANVLANPTFGTVLTEAGLGYTWSENAQLFRLTPWHNDPVTGSSGEALYIRDEETGHFWSPTPSPRGGSEPYVTRHGFGYSVFEHTVDGIRSELTVFVAVDVSVKFLSLRISNLSGRARRLSVTGYVEWVLGDVRSKSAMHVTTQVDAAEGAVYARNAYNSEFSAWVAFFDVDAIKRTVSGDRTEFIGRNRTLRDPAAMYRTRLSGKVGSGLDPCAAIQVPLDLAPGEQRQTVFRLGAASSAGASRELMRQLRGSTVAHDALEAVRRHWQHTLTAVQIDTPDQALNVMANGWLVYQTIACRLWGRSGFYQSGGAYGFRDQLQDVMALTHAAPGLARRQIALCASRQFVQGDVQHWWHPPSGAGVRTHCSDDYLWLPLATCRYVTTTGDTSILDEVAPFLEGRPVSPDSDSYYDLPIRSTESSTIYEHCVKAIVHGLRFGTHGLPLMGSGDWNDGMNLVGKDGKGESVWLAFFLCHVLGEFAALARVRGDSAFADRCDAEARQLAARIEQSAWDGNWYRRAYFDDGSPLGSRENMECQIDSIAQSWAVLSGVADPQRARSAMGAVDGRLVSRRDGLVRLLDPPFDSSALEPGYIRGYVPGVRENGGQYTHAAIWAAMAFAALGEGRRAWALATMINPVNHARTPDAAATYRAEPYVIAADVYALAPHTGRGGWTWYTGSAGWMYRLVLESLLGLSVEGDRLRVRPCLPAAWNEFTLRYRYRETMYRIRVHRVSTGSADEPGAIATTTVDGERQESAAIRLVDDGREHEVEVGIASPLRLTQASPT